MGKSSRGSKTGKETRQQSSHQHPSTTTSSSSQRLPALATMQSSFQVELPPQADGLIDYHKELRRLEGENQRRLEDWRKIELRRNEDGNTNRLGGGSGMGGAEAEGKDKENQGVERRR